MCLFSLAMHRDLAIVAISEFIWGLSECLFIFLLPLALQRWNTDTVQIGIVLSMIGVTMAVVQVPAGILRMADVSALHPNVNIKLHIVAPYARGEKVFQEIQRPVFSLLASVVSSGRSPFRGRLSVIS